LSTELAPELSKLRFVTAGFRQNRDKETRAARDRVGLDELDVLAVEGG